MKVKTLVSLAALVAVTAIPTVSSAQVQTRRYHSTRIHNSTPRYSRSYYGNSYYGSPYYSRTSYGYGPFYPSYIPVPSYQYYGAGGPYRSGGVSFYFGSGGGYTATYPYGNPYRYHTPYRSHRWR